MHNMGVHEMNTALGKTASLADVRWDSQGLAPAIVQDVDTREVLTLAYVNKESLALTLETGETWFWSRSRRGLWHKGATSGHLQRVVEICLDCDNDALLLRVKPAGPACHTGERSCFHRRLAKGIQGTEGNEGAEETEGRKEKEENSRGLERDVIGELEAVIVDRKAHPRLDSYTCKLFAAGEREILKKLGEESVEVIVASMEENERLICEAADLVYHLLVLLVERGLGWADVETELRRRFELRATRNP